MAKSHLGLSIATTIAGPVIALLADLPVGLSLFIAGVVGIAWSEQRLASSPR